MPCFVSAFTGKAANNIGGETLHSLLFLPTSGNFVDLRGLQLDRLQTRFTLPSFLIIDEYSMVGLRLLGRIDRRLCQATGHLQEPFGGVSIFLVGDILQLPPVKDTAVYKEASNRDSVEVQAGRSSFSLFNVVVELTENQRQADPAQAPFRDLLMQLRHGRHDISRCYDLLSTRMIGIVGQDGHAKFSNAVSLHHSNNRVDSSNIEELNKLIVASHSRPAQRICRIDAVCYIHNII
jgi:ATP-dependent DNA helicase PIF1